MGWLVTLGILALLAMIPLGVSASYNEDGALIRIIAGPVKIQVVPARGKKETKKEKKSEKKDSSPKPKKKQQKKSSKGTNADSSAPKEKKKGGPITDFLPLVKVVLKFLDGFRRKLRVNVLDVKLIMAADDPCDLALNYAKAWAAIGNLMPQLERVFVIQKRDVEVECDFAADKTRVLARLDLTITLGRLLALVFVLLGRTIIEFVKIIIKRKGGAINEPKSS